MKFFTLSIVAVVVALSITQAAPVLSVHTNDVEAVKDVLASHHERGDNLIDVLVKDVMVDTNADVPVNVRNNEVVKDVH